MACLLTCGSRSTRWTTRSARSATLRWSDASATGPPIRRSTGSPASGWLGLSRPFTRDDEDADYRWQLPVHQGLVLHHHALDRPLAERILSGQLIRDNLDIGRPDKVNIVFGRTIRQHGKFQTPRTFRTQVITNRTCPYLYLFYKKTQVGQYLKEGRALRTETTFNQPRDLGIGDELTNLAALEMLTRACPVDLVGRFRLDCSVDEERLRRHDLSDAEWARLEPLLPRHPRQGHRWNDHRLVIDGIFFRTRTGCPWRDLPERFGNWKTVYNRHRRWSGDGTWEMILDRLRAGCDEAGGRAWTVAVDATVVRAHQHAAGARREPPADIGPARLVPAVLSVPARIRG